MAVSCSSWKFLLPFPLLISETQPTIINTGVLWESESVSGKEPVAKKPMREIWISGWAGEEMWSRKRRLHNISEEWYREGGEGRISLNSS
jgi:hypothetical protein